MIISKLKVKVIVIICIINWIPNYIGFMWSGKHHTTAQVCSHHGHVSTFISFCFDKPTWPGYLVVSLDISKSPIMLLYNFKWNWCFFFVFFLVFSFFPFFKQWTSQPYQLNTVKVVRWQKSHLKWQTFR